MNASQVAKELAVRAESVARYLLPNGTRISNEWCVGSIDGEAGKSLKICLSGDKAGVWSDFATSDQSGDLLDLWAQNRKISLLQTILDAKQWLGVTQVKFDPQRSNNYVKPDIKKLPHKVALLAEQDPVFQYLTEQRKLTKETLTAFDIRSSGKSMMFPYWRDGQLIQIKQLDLDRPDGKKQIRVEANCEPCLFGWQALSLSSRIICLTEGEIDAMTLHQCGIAALSLPFGGGTGNKHKWLECDFDRLSIFDEIYLCFDQDDTGKNTENYLIDRLGRHRCRIVGLPHKDANDCLKNGMTAEQIKQIVYSAKTLDPVELKTAGSFVKQVLEGFYPTDESLKGYFFPWTKTHEQIMLRPEELSIWTGINGHGKSQILGQIILSAMQQGARICIASLELKPHKLLMRLTRQAAACELPAPENIVAAHNWYQDKLWLFDLVGTTKADRLLEVFLYARQRYEIDVFVIDSMMKCGIAEDDYNAQKAFIEQLCDFKNQYGCHIHLVTHPRKSSDEQIPPNKMDIKGSGAISDLADNCFTVWRNKPKEKSLLNQETNIIALKQQPDCLLICDKQRNGDWEGKIALWFDQDSYQFISDLSNKPHNYL